jgi:hypothetical protein
MILDPRDGDVEDDSSSTKRRSLAGLAGSLLVEISFTKLFFAWMMLLVVPSVLLGVGPMLAITWFRTLAGITSWQVGLWSVIALAVVAGIGYIGGHTLFRMVENSFWALSSLVVEPTYVLVREALQHFLHRRAARADRAFLSSRTRIASAAAAGLLVSGLAVWVAASFWPQSRWIGTTADLALPIQLAGRGLVNSVVIVALYLAASSLVWAWNDARTPAPRELKAFRTAPVRGRQYRIAHLSDLHGVGEQYGRRMECGRSGPAGNDRIERLFERLDAIDADAPFHSVIITGDMTDAGRAAEWAVLLDVLARHPRLADRVLFLPGNHDLNIADRSSPARLDLPTSPRRRLRQLRLLSAADTIQGTRVRVIDREAGVIGARLGLALDPHRSAIAKFADSGWPILSRELDELWAGAFPMVLPPDAEDGLGVVLLNSNADTHFSFTNALGVISTDQLKGIEIAFRQYPRASWIVALHHHVVEYPGGAAAFSERIGTALINGQWFVRSLVPMASRVVVMHGHRHIDWVGECAGLTIVSAPSPVMGAEDTRPYFHVHTLIVSGDGVGLLQPERIDV